MFIWSITRTSTTSSCSTGESGAQLSLLRRLSLWKREAIERVVPTLQDDHPAVVHVGGRQRGPERRRRWVGRIGMVLPVWTLWSTGCTHREIDSPEPVIRASVQVDSAVYHLRPWISGAQLVGYLVDLRVTLTNESTVPLYVEHFCGIGPEPDYQVRRPPGDSTFVLMGELCVRSDLRPPDSRRRVEPFEVKAGTSASWNIRLPTSLSGLPEVRTGQFQLLLDVLADRQWPANAERVVPEEYRTSNTFTVLP